MKRLGILVFLYACGGVPQNTDTLGDAIRSYNDGVRWGRYAVAAAKVPVKERAEFIADMDERAENIKITDYDIVDVNSRDEREARVRIKIGWYDDREGTVHETHAVQTWERQGKLWFMVEEVRVRGKEMPGLPEPIAKDRAKEPTAKEPTHEARTSRR